MGGSTNITTTQTNFFPDGRIKDATSKSEDGRVFRLVKYGYNPEGKIAGITEDDPIINKRLSVMFTYSTDSTLSRIAEFKGDVEDRQLEITSQKGHPTELLGKVANVEQWRVTYQHELDGSVTITRYSKEDGEPEKESGNFHFDSVGRPSRMDYLQPDSVDPDQPYRKGQYKFEYLPNLLRHIHIAMDFPKINDKCDLDVTLFPNGDEASGQVNSKRFAFANRLGVPGCMVEITEKNISRDAMGNIVRDTQGIHQTEDLGRTVTSADFDISYVYTYY